MGDWRQKSQLPWSEQFEKLFKSLASCKKKNVDQAKSLLQQLSPVLTLESFYYKTYNDLAKGRSSLLSCWETILQLIGFVPADDLPMYYNAILSILYRKELDLRHFAGVTMDQIQAIAQAATEISGKDTKWMVSFRSLVVDTTSYICDSLASAPPPGKAFLDSLLDFCAETLAVSYLFIPQLPPVFANLFLKDPEVDSLISGLQDADRRGACQFQGTMAGMEQEEGELGRMESPAFKVLIALIASGLPGASKSSSTCERIVSKTEWLSRLFSNRKYYFTFMRRLVNYVLRFVDGRTFQWSALPEYFTAVRPVLLEMNANQPTEYSSHLADCTTTLLCNAGLLAPFLRLSLQKTDINDFNATIDSIQLIDRWFSHLKGIQLPANFDYDHFIMCMTLLLNSEHFMIVSSVLLLLYDHYELFDPTVFRPNFVQDVLLHRNFYRFFLHWDHITRKIYHHILIYKITKPLNDPDPEGSRNLEGKIKKVLMDVASRFPAATRFLKPPNPAFLREYQTYAESSIQEFALCEKEWREWLQKCQASPQPMPDLREKLDLNSRSDKLAMDDSFEMGTYSKGGNSLNTKVTSDRKKTRNHGEMIDLSTFKKFSTSRSKMETPAPDAQPAQPAPPGYNPAMPPPGQQYPPGYNPAMSPPGQQYPPGAYPPSYPPYQGAPAPGMPPPGYAPYGVQGPQQAPPPGYAPYGVPGQYPVAGQPSVPSPSQGKKPRKAIVPLAYLRPPKPPK